MVGTPFLMGSRVLLRSLVEDDMAGPYLSWFNDEEVCRGNSHHAYPFTPEDALRYIREESRRRDTLALAVTVRADGRHIGNITLQRIQTINRTAEFAIVIGDKSAWRQGYATEAATLLCHHGFTALNLHRIECGTFADNESMIRLAERLGMREEGRRRDAAFKSGRYVDIVEFGVLSGEFVAHVSKGEEPA